MEYAASGIEIFSAAIVPVLRKVITELVPKNDTGITIILFYFFFLLHNLTLVRLTARIYFTMVDLIGLNDNTRSSIVLLFVTV